MNHPMTHAELLEAFDNQDLFEDKTWRVSPEPWPLTERQAKEIEQIGQACLEFYRAVELLYTRSWSGKNLLRNGKQTAAWVADYYDRGKPESIVQHARSDGVKRSQPVVIRPDLLITEEGLALTEIDSVPGGIGLTAFLNNLYQGQGSVIGSDSQMIDLFYESLASLRSDKKNPLIVIVVSDEANTYRPEMDWLSEQLQQKGYRIYTLHPGDLFPIGDAICADIDGDPEEVDIIYRFWELFDMENIPITKEIMRVLDAGSEMVVTPPMRHFQEEKLSLSLFHHHRLSDYWKENLSKGSYKILKKIVPTGWIMDPVDLPPNAVLDAPFVGGKPIYKWEQLGEASQKERNLILKLSGFHENAWGARSVLYGSDASRSEWVDGISDALQSSGSSLHILQEYRKPARLSHPVFYEEEELRPMSGRMRLCPYYFVQGDKAKLGGILSTFCPADKKIIHGMRDAALIPASISPREAKS